MYQRRHNSKRRYQKRRGGIGRAQTSLPKPKRYMDINCNLGQGFGIYQNEYEETVLPYVTSVNIACGIHNGEPTTMARAVEAAKGYNLNIGALVGYPDRQSNGEREMYFDVEELRATVLYQLGALHALLQANGLELKHVRTHGFLYKQLSTDLLIAETVAKAIAEYSPWVTLIGLGGPVLYTACTNANIKVGQEILIDRRYRRDGHVLPYTKTIDGKRHLEDSASRAREFLQKGTVTSEDNSKLKINAETIHIPSDTKESIELARIVWSMVPEPRALDSDKYKNYCADLAALKS